MPKSRRPPPDAEFLRLVVLTDRAEIRKEIRRSLKQAKASHGRGNTCERLSESGTSSSGERRR